MRHSAAATAFYGINALLFPVTLTGYVLWVGKFMVRRGTRVSGTAQGPLSTRYFEHKLGTREDEAAARLMAELLQSCGLTLGEQRTLGRETDVARAWGGFATAIVT